MNCEQAKRKWNPGYRLGALACLLTLQSCSNANKVTTECYQIQAIITEHQYFPTGDINKASETAQAKAEKDLADALSAVKVSDTKLKEKRDDIVAFSRELHTLSLQAAEVMTADGYLSSNTAAQYQIISTERITISNQLLTEQTELQTYCSRP